MEKEKQLNNLIDLVKSEQCYWCEWCKRNIPAEKNGGHGLLFVHDDVYHPTDYVYESGDVHIIQ